MKINKTFTNKPKPDKNNSDKAEQDEPIYIIKCIDGKTKKENVLYIDYKSKDARLCGYIPGEPIGNNKVNSAVEACKEYLDVLAKNNKDIYKKVLNHIKYNKSSNYQALVRYYEESIQKRGVDFGEFDI